MSGQICQICGDDVGLTPQGELFVACNECAFPVCRDCYDYERREGSQVCPQCKTRFKRLKGKHFSYFRLDFLYKVWIFKKNFFILGCPRVAGDEDEDDIDDLENEFSFAGKNREDMQYGAEAMLQGQMRFGRGTDVDMPQGVNAVSNVPLLTNGEMVCCHCLVFCCFGFFLLNVANAYMVNLSIVFQNLSVAPIVKCATTVRVSHRLWLKCL